MWQLPERLAQAAQVRKTHTPRSGQELMARKLEDKTGFFA